jgi:putative two-component system response regulator
VSEPKGTVLVVDDDQAVRSVVSRKMQGDGYTCTTAADGREALDKTAVQGFDVVLLDIKMPGPSGMEVLPKIVTQHPDTCVIMITAVVDTQTAVEAMKLGAFDYVTKPFNLDDLGIRVEKALERKKLVKENRDFQLQQQSSGN